MTLDRRHLLFAGLPLLAGCGMTTGAGPQDIRGQAPSGSIEIDEIVATGATGGTGRLTFRGTTHAFKLVGGVTGGGGAAQTTARGHVYNLRNLSDFAGRYTQTSGAPGVQESGTTQLWLRNGNGVVIHATGRQNGILVSLGREQILIELL